jgi:hypothetical protein
MLVHNYQHLLNLHLLHQNQLDLNPFLLNFLEEDLPAEYFLLLHFRYKILLHLILLSLLMYQNDLHLLHLLLK